MSGRRHREDRTTGKEDRSGARAVLGNTQIPAAQLVDFLPDPAFAIDTGGRIILWNKAAEDLLGVKAADMLGKGNYEHSVPFYGVRRPTLADLVLGADEHAGQYYLSLARRQDTIHAESCVQTPEGKSYVMGKASPIYDASGAVIGAIETIRDITERVRREEGVRSREKKYRDIFENVSDLLYVHDLEGRFIESNLPFKTEYGYTGDDLEHTTILDLIPERHRPLFRDYLSRVLDSGRDEGIMNLLTKTGETRILEYRNSLVRNDHGRPVSIRGSARDITEHVEAVQELRRSEQRYRFLAENMHDVIWMLDLDLRYVYVSPSVERIRGYSAEETMRQSIEEVLTPESFQKAVRALEGELDLERRGVKHDPYWSRAIVAELVKKDGSTIWAELTVSFLRDEQGNITHILGSTRDVTEREKGREALRESEERFRAMAEASPVVFWMSSPDPFDKVLYVSPAFERIFGYPCADLILNPGSWFEYVLPEDKAQIMQLIESKGAKTVDFECRIVRPDKALRWVRIRVAPVLDREGNTVMLSGIAEDITEAKRAEQEKTIYEERLARAQKLEAIGTLAAGIAHDFNNILSIIIGHAELAMDETPEDGAAAGSLREVLKAGDRAKDLVSQILTFSRQTRTEKQPVQVHLIVKEAMKLLRPSIPSTIAITLDVLPGVPAVLADPTQIHQVVMSLCTNAYQAMLDKGGTLAVSLAPAEVNEASNPGGSHISAGSYLKLTVSDTGHGMDRMTMSRIFDPFFTTREIGRGTGLSLAAVHGIVSDLSGVITVSSTPGKGSSFGVYLPAFDGEARERQAAEDAPLPGDGKRILLVDDESAILKFAQNMLEQMGYAVTASSSGVEALDIFTRSPCSFDLVITDQTMPVITGIDLAEKVLAVRGDTPIILVTGYCETVSAAQARERGIQAYLEKPFTRKTLAAAISRVLCPPPGRTSGTREHGTGME